MTIFIPFEIGIPTFISELLDFQSTTKMSTPSLSKTLLSHSFIQQIRHVIAVQYRTLNNNPDTSPRQSIRLDCPGNYFLTTFEESDAEALYEVLTIRSVSNCLIRVPEPCVFLPSTESSPNSQANTQTDTLLKAPRLGFPESSSRKLVCFPSPPFQQETQHSSLRIDLFPFR